MAAVLGREWDLLLRRQMKALGMSHRDMPILAGELSLHRANESGFDKKTVGFAFDSICVVLPLRDGSSFFWNV